MSEIIFVVEQAPEGGLTARALDVSIFTQAESIEELHTKVRDAVRCHFDIPPPDAGCKMELEIQSILKDRP
jgi:hypothetical protein